MSSNEKPGAVDAVVVGAGFAGLYMLHRLRELGLKAVVFEAGDGVGGTWYWNRYPGARCDVESMEYSYQFSEELQQQWSWSERYAPQPEILAYANHVADRFNLNKDIVFRTRVIKAHYDEMQQLWLITTDAEPALIKTRFCIMATGCLSSANTPQFSGLEEFNGHCYHTGNWPQQEIDFSGQQVGVVGTGSSAVQSIPLIAAQARHLTVFQRTASFSIPAHNGAMDPTHEAAVKADYAGFRARNSTMFAALNSHPNHQSALEVTPQQRDKIYQQRWLEGGLSFLASFNDIGVNTKANQTMVDFIHRKIHQIVKDPETAKRLCPQTVVGCKRLCVDTDYYQTFNRDNVTLVDVQENPVTRITPQGILLGGKDRGEEQNQEIPLDSLVLATGFDAITGALLRVDIRGRNGLSLGEKWSAGPKTYLGLTVAGFPNLFTITGPGSPSVLANMIVAIEQHVNWISNCIQHLYEQSLCSIEALHDAEENWVSHVNEVASGSLIANGCNSWYLGANVPGKARVFMPYLGYPKYVERCEQVAGGGYIGFETR